jgi:hypothetical protein
MATRLEDWYPWTDSNRRTWLRRPVLYPLSYRGMTTYPHQPIGDILPGRKALTVGLYHKGRLTARPRWAIMAL